MFREGCGLQTAGDLRDRAGVSTDWGGGLPSPELQALSPTLTVPWAVSPPLLWHPASPAACASSGILKSWVLGGSSSHPGLAWEPKSQGKSLALKRSQIRGT